MYLFSLLNSSAIPLGASPVYLVGAGASSVCHSEHAAGVGFAVLAGKSALTALPTPWDLLVTSPGCHSAALQCYRQHRLNAGNLIYCKLTQPFNYWFVYWGEKRKHMQLNKHLGNYLSLPFFRLSFSQTPLLPPFSLQLPLFSLLVPIFPPSHSFLWGDGQSGSRYVSFCPCNSLLALHFPHFLLPLCPSVTHPWPVKKCCAVGLLPMLVDTPSPPNCQENKMGVFHHIDLHSQWKSGV